MVDIIIPVTFIAIYSNEDNNLGKSIKLEYAEYADYVEYAEYAKYAE